MIEILKVIALLCNVNPTIGDYRMEYSPQSIQKFQRKCHKEYLTCLSGSIHTPRGLRKCMGKL